MNIKILIFYVSLTVHFSITLANDQLDAQWCLWPLACWDRGFESHRGHGYLSVV